MITAVINTSALGPRAHESIGSFGRPHADRAGYMRELILPRALEQFDEVIVAGEFEPGRGYTYVHSPSHFFNCRDVLAQRQAGFELAKNDVILFQMDDHAVSESFADDIDGIDEPWEILSPARRSIHDGRLLNSGWNEERDLYRSNPYLHTHVIVMNRQSIVRCPWIGLPPIHRFDVVHTMWFLDAGLRIKIAKSLSAFDLEE